MRKVTCCGRMYFYTLKCEAEPFSQFLYLLTFVVVVDVPELLMDIHLPITKAVQLNDVPYLYLHLRIAL